MAEYNLQLGSGICRYAHVFIKIRLYYYEVNNCPFNVTLFAGVCYYHILLLFFSCESVVCGTWDPGALEFLLCSRLKVA